MFRCFGFEKPRFCPLCQGHRRSERLVTVTGDCSLSRPHFPLRAAPKAAQSTPFLLEQLAVLRSSRVIFYWIAVLKQWQRIPVRHSGPISYTSVVHLPVVQNSSCEGLCLPSLLLRGVSHGNCPCTCWNPAAAACTAPSAGARVRSNLLHVFHSSHFEGFIYFSTCTEEPVCVSQPQLLFCAVISSCSPGICSQQLKWCSSCGAWKEQRAARGACCSLFLPHSTERCPRV